ncbi:MAG: GMC family oxidoreductase [Deltaproteobacteria bacterium]|nr:GMC family oxidoreductase [Deltaproteobacteria bacterium]
MVVIGTGPTGAVAARALVQAGIAVTVLEAGSRESARGFILRGAGLTLARKRRELPPQSAWNVPPGGPSAAWFAEYSAGGLSNHWTGAVPRYAPSDFTEGEALGPEFRWPVSYADLEPHYARIEELLHIVGGGEDVPSMPAGHVSHKLHLPPDWQTIDGRARKQGRGVAVLPLSYMGGATASASGTPFNSYVRLLDGLPRTPRFEIRFRARVIRLEWSGEKRRVTRAIYVDDATGLEHAVEADHFVLAAGPLFSARILLESACNDFAQGLGNVEGVLGAYLHDHPYGKLELRTEQPLSIFPPLCVTRRALASSEPLRAAQAVLWSSTGARVKSWARLTFDRSSAIGFNFFGTHPPEKKHRLRLLPDEPDEKGRPGIALDFALDAPMVRTLEETRDELLGLIHESGFKSQTLVWEVVPAGTSFHYGGTVRMHAEPRFGMLDGFNRLHAVPNVRVVDASAFTTGPEKNPTLTAMALASRSAEELAASLRR